MGNCLGEAVLRCGSQEDFSEEEEEGSGLFGGSGRAGRASLQAGLLCKLAAERSLGMMLLKVVLLL